MHIQSIIVLVASVFAVLLGVAAVVRKRDTLASWAFLSGMLALAADAVFGGLALRSQNQGELDAWLTAQLIARCFLPGIWLCFSLIYCRGNAAEFLARWRWGLVARTRRSNRQMSFSCTTGWRIFCPRFD